WSRAEFARHVAYQCSKAKLFENFKTGTITPTVMADTVLAQFGVDNPSATTRQALINYLTQDNTPSNRWALPVNAITMVLLSPDFQLA
ncbi:MAG: hypothetical protein AB7O61_06225, partial [Acidimicrobiia bacterium]